MSMNNFEKFVALHNRAALFLLGNVWDVNSAGIFEERGFEALGTSSAAIANMLGYTDGEEMSFSELLYIVKQIVAHVSIPLSVDLEGGYGRDPSEIINHIEQLHELGVAGINIEDSLVTKKREIRSIDDFCNVISAIKNGMRNGNIGMFLNVRTDAFLLGVEKPLEETLKRITAFEKTGADGIFIPCITDEDDIKAIVSSTKLPVNVMCMPELPSFQVLTGLGVRRISMGNFLYSSMTRYIENAIQAVQNRQSFKPLFQADIKKV